MFQQDKVVNLFLFFFFFLIQFFFYWQFSFYKIWKVKLSVLADEGQHTVFFECVMLIWLSFKHA